MTQKRKSWAFIWLIVFLCLVLALGILVFVWGLMPGNRKNTLPTSGQSANAGLEKGAGCNISELFSKNCRCSAPQG